ncbi:MAG: hypothetical protein WCL32_23730 [Planctomycetota bacterium]|jgi:hypothetical protein
MASSQERNDMVEKNSSVMGYFRKIFKARPELLATRSNDEVIQRWLADHPGHDELPKSVRNSLANLKSILRKKQCAEGNHAGSVPVLDGKPIAGKPKSLEMLEAQIDDALTLARLLDRDGLASVIKLLHRARNEVVWKIGQ